MLYAGSGASGLLHRGVVDRVQPGPRGTGSHPIHDQPGVSTTRPDYRTEPQSPRLSLVIPTQSQILSTTFTPITRTGAAAVLIAILRLPLALPV